MDIDCCLVFIRFIMFKVLWHQKFLETLQLSNNVWLAIHWQFNKAPGL